MISILGFEMYDSLLGDRFEKETVRYLDCRVPNTAIYNWYSAGIPECIQQVRGDSPW